MVFLNRSTMSLITTPPIIMIDWVHFIVGAQVLASFPEINNYLNKNSVINGFLGYFDISA